MECPHCKHEAPPAALVKCSHCGNMYERQLLEEYEHIGYLLQWFEKHRAEVGISAKTLDAELVARKAELEVQMHLVTAPTPEPEPEVETVAAPPVVQPVTVEEVKPAVVAVVPPTPKPVPAPVALHVSEPMPALKSAPVPEPLPAPKPLPIPPRPVRPAQPASPPINWGQVWDKAVKFVVSGALLRALLYMGAFMIVVSAAVLVISFWNIFPPFLQVVFIFSLPTSFYAAGWLTRTRLKLQEAGIVITGIGAVLLAVDFAALYQFMHLNLDINLYWLIAALITSAVYTFSAYRLKGEFFDYLMLLGGINVLLALTRVLNLPIEWTIASVPLAGAGMAGLAANLWPRGDAWRDTARAARYLPQVLIPISLVAVLLFGRSNSRAATMMAAFLFAALAYGLLAWKFPAVHQLTLALVNLAIAVGFGVRLFDTTDVWLPTAGAVLSAGYVLTAWKLFGTENTSVTFLSKDNYRRVLNGLGLFLALAAFIGSLFMLAAEKRLEAAVPLTVLALSFCAWNLLLRQPLFGLLGAGLLLVPFWLWLELADVQPGFYALAYLLLVSCAYLPAGMLMRRVDKKLARPFDEVGWLVACLVFFAVFIPDYQSPNWVPALTLTLLAAYTSFNAWYFRYVSFAWATAFVIPVALALWLNVWQLPSEQVGLLWAGLAFVYLFIERFLNRQTEQAWAKLSFRLPFGMGMIILAVTAWIVSFSAFIELYTKLDRIPLTLVTQGTLVLLTILAARIYRSGWPLFIEPLLSTLLSVFFFLAYAPSIFGRSLEWFQFGLVFCALAWVHLLAAAALDRLPTRYAHGLYLGGYGLATVAVLWTVTDLPTLLWTLGAFILVMSASAALTHFNRHRTWDEIARLFGQPETIAARLVRGAFLWPAAWLFPVWCALLMIQLETPLFQRWLAFGLPALLYLGLGTQLAKREHTYAWPFFSAAHTVVLIALLFNIDHVLISSSGIVATLFKSTTNAADLTGQALVQLLAVTFYAAWAWMKRDQLFAHVASWLSILPLTSFMLAIPGTSAHDIVIAWTAWAAFLLLIGFLLDRPHEGLPRHAHAPYLAGYALATLALLVSIHERQLNIIVLGMSIALATWSAVAVHFNRHRAWDEVARLFGAPETIAARLVRGAFLWPIAWLFPVWCALLLVQLETPIFQRWLAFGLPALLYLALGTRLAKREPTYAWPFFSAAHIVAFVALLFNIDQVLISGVGIALTLSRPGPNMPDSTVAIEQGLIQLLAVTFYAAWAWMKRDQFFAHVAAWLSILPLTSFMLAIPGTSAHDIVIAWTAWAAFLLLIGFLLDRPHEGLPRHAHGPYLAGYALAIFALVISIYERQLNIIVLGMSIALAVLSAVAVHFNRHRTWDEVARLFGGPETIAARLVRGAFLWPAAWLFPVWCALLMIQLETPIFQRWLAFGLPALLYLGLGTRLAKREHTYAWPFFSAAHIVVLIALLFNIDRVLISSSGIVATLFKSTTNAADLTGQALVQLLAVTFYAAWAWIKRQQFFAHVASWLSILPLTSFMLAIPGTSAHDIVIAWTAWAAFLLLIGFLLDRPHEGLPRHAHAPYLAGYALATLALLVSIHERQLNIIVLGMSIALATWSAVAVHFNRHRAWDDFIDLIWEKDTLGRRATRLSFLFFAAYTLPVWVMQFEVDHFLSAAWQGLSLVLLAPLYIACDLFLRRLNRDYTWPFYSAGYAMTVIGALMSLLDERLAIYAFALNVAVYAASSAIFRQRFWLYLATCLAPVTVLMALHYNDRFTSQWIAWLFTAIVLLYFGLGQLLERRKDEPAGSAPFALALYGPGYLLSIIAILLANGDRSLALGVYSANIVLYALSAWRFREPLFLYPATWLSIVPYSIAATSLFTIPAEWRGVAWLPHILLLIGLGRFVFHKTPLDLKTPGAVFASLRNPAIPFYSISYALTVMMLLDSRGTPTSLTIAFAIVTALYLASALLFRHPSWLYPTLFTAHLTILAYFSIHPSDSPLRFISIPFLWLTWLEALAGYVISRRYPVTQMRADGRLVFKFFGKEVDFKDFPCVGYLTIPSWAQPIFIVVALDTFLWETLALSGAETGIWVSAGFFLLLGLLATLWSDKLLAHISLGLGALAAGYQLHAMGMSASQIIACLGGIALGLYLLSWLVERLEGAFTVWRRPLVNVAVTLSVLSLIGISPNILGTAASSALTLGFNGALYLSMSLRRRTYVLGYFGMGLLLAGWSLFLFFVENIGQPQFYAIPGGLYFVGMGFFERARRPGRFALIIESFGLALLLVTSFIQSVNSETGFPYFLLLLAEGLLVAWWGAARHLRVPFVIGLTACVVNVLAQLVILIRVYDVNRWVIIFGAGILLVGLGLFVERRREMLLSRAQEFRDQLERWD